MFHLSTSCYKSWARGVPFRSEVVIDTFTNNFFDGLIIIVFNSFPTFVTRKTFPRSRRQNHTSKLIFDLICRIMNNFVMIDGISLSSLPSKINNAQYEIFDLASPA